MKKLFCVLFAVLMLTGLMVGVTVPVSAENAVCSGTWGSLYWELNQANGHLTISGNGEMDGFYYDGQGNETWLNEAWLAYKKTSIKTVTVAEGVTSIGDGAFMACTQLKSITLPSSLIAIEDVAFDSCLSLGSIVIPSSVSTIGYDVFAMCNNLVSITVDSENEIYHSAGNCIIDTNRKMVVAGCKNSTIPDDGSVSVIGPRAFYNCSGLKTIVIPNGVTTIGQSAFSQCDSLSTVYISDSIEEIEVRAFFGSDNLKKIFYCGTDEQWSNVSRMMDFLDEEMNYTLLHHAWNSGDVTVEPTHLETGEKNVMCTICGKTDTESIPKLAAHEYGEWQQQNAEKHQRMCACGAVQSVSHKFDNKKDADCNDCGYVRLLKEEDTTDFSITTAEPIITEDIAMETENNEKTFTLDFMTGCDSTVTVGVGLTMVFAFGAVGAVFKKKRN